jgi:hypothetical protein
MLAESGSDATFHCTHATAISHHGRFRRPSLGPQHVAARLDRPHIVVQDTQMSSAAYSVEFAVSGLKEIPKSARATSNDAPPGS